MNRDYSFKDLLSKKNILRFIRNLALTLLVISPVPIFLLSTYAYQLTFPDEKLPFVQFSGLDPKSEAIVSWESSQAESSTVWYGLENNNDALAFKKTDEEKIKIHRVVLTNLQPDTRYYYRVGMIQEENVYRSPIYTFKTAPDHGEKEFNFCAYSDSQQFLGLGWHRLISEAIARHDDLSFVLEPGDVCQNWDYKPDWNQFFQEANQYMKKYPYVPGIGNHDGYYPDEDPNNEKHWYEQYFGATNTSTPVHSFYYSFEWGNTQFISAEIAKTGDENKNVERNRIHDRWLNRTLQAGQHKDFRILFFHRNIFSGEEDNRDLIGRMVPIVEKYNVSLVLYGHHHHYERFLHNDHTYICLGGGGGQQLGSNYYELGDETKSFNVGPSYTYFSVKSDQIDLVTYTPQQDVIDECSLIMNGQDAILKEEA